MKKWKQHFVVRQEGSATIEATMVFTVIFFSLILIIFMGIILYQEVHMQSLAIQASERGAIVYASRTSDFGTGLKSLADFEDRDPYRYIPFFDSGKTSKYKKLINHYVETAVVKNNVVSGTSKNGGTYVTVNDYIIIKKIKVNIKKDYKLPTDGIANMFGSDGLFHIDTTAVSTVTDPVEFMRNTDLCMDVLSKTKIFDKAQEFMGKAMGLLEKYGDMLN